MHRTTLMIPSELKARAQRRAEELEISFGELVRRTLSHALDEDPFTSRSNDPALADETLFADDHPADLADRHDHYLYGD